MSPTLERVDKAKPKLGGGGPGKIPHCRGFGGGDDGDHRPPDDFRFGKDRLRRFRIGVGASIVSVGMLFVGLSVVYVWREGTYGWDSELHVPRHVWHPLTLPYHLLFANTVLLTLSSISLELARRGLLRKAEYSILGIRPPKMQTDLPWLAITVLLGFGFLTGQVMVWKLLRAEGIYLASYPSGSFFYLLTGLHAVHLSGGLIALLYTLIGSWFGMKLDSQRIAVDITGWYWHFMGALWIYLFALLHFARGG